MHTNTHTHTKERHEIMTPPLLAIHLLCFVFFLFSSIIIVVKYNWSRVARIGCVDEGGLTTRFHSASMGVPKEMHRRRHPLDSSEKLRAAAMLDQSYSVQYASRRKMGDQHIDLALLLLLSFTI